MLIIISSFSLLPLQGAGGWQKKSRPFGRDRSFLCLCLCFDKYYPAPFFKEVIKEEVESICNNCFHQVSNISMERMQIMFLQIYYTNTR
jgi:hypothetical protein